MKTKFEVIAGGKRRNVFDDLDALRIDDDGQPAPEIKRRQFTRYDEAWRATILAGGRSVRPPTHRLVAVLLAEADFRRQIKIGAAISAAASLTSHEKRRALEQLEKLGLITVEWRGRGRIPIATPLRLGGRPVRK
jgi:hypothetical protein